MGEVGGYTLELYCDYPGCHGQDKRQGARTKFAQYCAETYAQCVRKARRDGWTINRRAAWVEGQNGSGRCICPLHKTERRRS
jgi:hypothetical protein